MSFSFGSEDVSEEREQRQAPAVAAPSAAEEELRQLNLAFAKLQLAQAQAAGPQVDQLNQPGGLNTDILNAAAQRLLAAVQGTTPMLSPEEDARLREIYGTAGRQADEDLLRFGGQIAASRGLALSDSPIADELLRQRARIGETLGAQRASASLTAAQNARQFAASLAQFQQGLRQQAFANRLALAGMQAPSYQFQNALFGERLQAAPIQSTGLRDLAGSTSRWGLSGQDASGYGNLITALK